MDEKFIGCKCKIATYQSKMDLVNLLININNQNNEAALQNFELLQEILYGKRKYTVFPRINSFERYDDDEFTSRYRLNKNQVNSLYDMLDGENDIVDLRFAVKRNY